MTLNDAAEEDWVRTTFGSSGLWIGINDADNEGQFVWASGEPLAYAKGMLASFRPSGYSIGWNVGEAAGQHLRHVHLHVICRFETEAAAGLGLNGLIRSVNEPLADS